MQRIKIACFIFSLLALVQCGRDRSLLDSFSSEPQNGGGTQTVRLLLFAAGNCIPCREELPEVKALLATKFQSYSTRLIPMVYLEAGNSGEKPNATNAAAFKAEMDLPFEVIPDNLTKKYRSYYGNTGQTPVPATVITTEDFSKIKVFAPGKLSVDTLEASLHAALGAK